MNDATRKDWYMYFINKRNAENNQKRKNRLFFGNEYALTRAVEPDFKKSNKKSDAQGACRRLYPTFA